MRKPHVIFVLALCLFAGTCFAQTKKATSETPKRYVRISFNKLSKFINKNGCVGNLSDDDSAPEKAIIYCWTVPQKDIVAAGIAREGSKLTIFFGSADVAGSVGEADTTLDNASTTWVPSFNVYSDGSFVTDRANGKVLLGDVERLEGYISSLEKQIAVLEQH